MFRANALFVGLFQFTLSVFSFAQPMPEGRLMRFPDVTKDKIVFSYGGDLWLVSRDGGVARRVTSHPGQELFGKFSPDGKWIAFTTMYRNFQICVVPAEGGTATVLVEGEDPSWAPNSRTLIFTRRQSGRNVLSLLDVPTKQVKDVSRSSGTSSQSQPSWAR